MMTAMKTLILAEKDAKRLLTFEEAEQGRTGDDEIAIFVTTDLPVQDVVTANITYKKAVANGIGKVMEIV
jgi:ornithine cyclodeaminase/alanine dehydrogenase-like protein (mu-crystallin family)